MPRKTKVNAHVPNQQPPYNIEAEHCVLGSLLILPEVCDEISPILRPEDFYDEANAVLYRCMLSLRDAGEKIDIVLLAAKLKNAGDFDRIGGAPYLARVTNSVPNAAHAVYYANEVRDKSLYRAMIPITTEALQNAYNQRGAAADIATEAINALERILDGNGGQSTVRAGEAFARVACRARNDLGKEEHKGKPTGIGTFDRLIGGLYPGELVILAARPSAGKTALAGQWAMGFAESGSAVYLASLEMSVDELCTRLLCHHAGVDGSRVRTGEYDQDDVQLLELAADHLRSVPLFIDDRPSLTVSAIRASARRLNRQGQLSLVCVDYLSRIEPTDRRLKRHEQIGEITGGLKRLARELDVPVLCLCQLNRQIEGTTDHIPRLAHLKDSGDIEQDADVVMFLHRPELFRPNDADLRGKASLVVAKNRNGATGSLPLLWVPETTEFRELETPCMEGVF